MSEKKQGAAEWLRGIIDEYEADKRSCPEKAKMFGIDCNHEESCTDCEIDKMKAIADRIDAERALPEGVEWPRFEDGELVKVGDDVEYKGETMRVYLATLDADGWALWCSREGIDGRLSGSYGERVKRPAPEVLDADGVPIEVGDVVYLVDDDDGALIVECIDVSGEKPVVDLMYSDDRGNRYFVDPKKLTHERPDSWKRLEEDARKTACAYAPAPLNEDGLVTCDGCRFQKSESCGNEMTLDVVERAKKLAGIEESDRISKLAEKEEA